MTKFNMMQWEMSDNSQLLSLMRYSLYKIDNNLDSLKVITFIPNLYPHSVPYNIVDEIRTPLQDRALRLSPQTF